MCAWVGSADRFGNEERERILTQHGPVGVVVVVQCRLVAPEDDEVQRRAVGRRLLGGPHHVVLVTDDVREVVGDVREEVGDLVVEALHVGLDVEVDAG